MLHKIKICQGDATLPMMMKKSPFKRMTFWKRKLLAVWPNCYQYKYLLSNIKKYIKNKHLSEMSHGSPRIQTHAGENYFRKVGNIRFVFLQR